MDELIVEFARGTSEDDARKLVESAGANVRRRMRSDHEDLVTLLVKVERAAFDAVSKKIDADARVARTEKNATDYGIAND